MIANKLMDALANELSNLFKDFEYKFEGEGIRKMQVFKHNLPVSKEEDSPEPFPFLLIRLPEGEIMLGSNIVKVMIIIGIYDPNENMQGTQDVLSAIELIRQDFGRTTTLNGKYSLIYSDKYPIRWSIPDEDTYPYFYGGMELYFRLPRTEREDRYC